MGRDRLMRLAGRVPLTSGAALAAQLMMAAQRAGVTVRLGAPLRRLVVEQGRVVGVEVGDAAAPRRIGAPAGVVLCGGGFARNPDMRRALQPVDGQYSSASPDDTGDAITAAREVGAALDLLEEAWWGPCVLYPGDNPGFFLWERSLPGSLMVDGSGRRFANESQSYDSLGREMLRQGTKDAWLIIDARHRRRYVFGAMPPGRTPQAMFDSGFFRRADTLEQLAKDCGLDPQTVAATVARFNGFARTGVDEDFGRGVAAYDNYWGDPTHKPNHNLGALLEPPFLATRVHLGDLGTKGGVVTDEDGRALRADGSAIEGLFAAGNCTASVMGRAYPAPGATLGPARTFAYRAARRAAAERVRPAVAA
jgi:3-oxosteroid 1-dehydrogenase